MKREQKDKNKSMEFWELDDDTRDAVGQWIELGLLEVDFDIENGTIALIPSEKCMSYLREGKLKAIKIRQA